MCGIFALLHPGRPVAAPALQAALDALRHRGPDDRGLWADAEAGVTLAQTRLAIQDVSPAGHQPMLSANGRLAITFNGEIYNHLELRRQLEAGVGTSLHSAPAWRGHSDTETLLAAIESWGLETTLSRVVGMFAFCLWDRDTGRMHLARDRVGEKPIFYGYAGGVFAVASEVRALRAVPGFEGTIDRDSVALMMRFLAIPAPRSVFKGIASLPPGHWLTITPDQARRLELPRSRVYWSAAARAEALSATQEGFRSDAEAVDALQSCLSGAVGRQLISDVPLGAFLSGGIDSSIVVALMQAHARRSGASAVRTFSIGFGDSDYNEAHHAKRVAEHLGTSHTELYVTNQECLALVPRIAGCYDEPFAESSQIGVYLVSRLARGSVSVALTGDGGDELFGGYNRYVNGASWWRRSSRIPAPFRSALRSILGHIPPDGADHLAASVSRRLPAAMQLRRPSNRLQKVAAILAAADAKELYAGFVQHWPSEVVLGASPLPTPMDEPWADLPSLEEQMMMMDLGFILPTALLSKVDRAAMANSLETRTPFLDPSVMEFAWRLPLRDKIRDGQGKWLLRQLLHRHVPPALVERPKMGFESPVMRWLKGPLRPWAEALLDEHRLRSEGFFDVAAIRTCWRQHLAGERDHTSRLWAVLMFQSWREINQMPTMRPGFDSVSAVAA